MKKLISLILCMALLLSMGLSAFAQERFEFTGPAAWAEKAGVAKLYPWAAESGEGLSVLNYGSDFSDMEAAAGFLRDYVEDCLVPLGFEVLDDSDGAFTCCSLRHKDYSGEGIDRDGSQIVLELESRVHKSEYMEKRERYLTWIGLSCMISEELTPDELAPDGSFTELSLFSKEQGMNFDTRMDWIGGETLDGLTSYSYFLGGESEDYIMSSPAFMDAYMARLEEQGFKLTEPVYETKTEKNSIRHACFADALSGRTSRRRPTRV